MLKTKRQSEILEILKEKNFATVDELSKKLYASLPTIRRDLSLLESEGYVKRCHGGAMIIDTNTKPPIYFPREQNAQGKAKMCRVAASLIAERNVVFVDGSTTVFHMPDYIEKGLDITVITNGLPITTRFADTGFTVYSIGGRLLKEALAYVGKPAEAAVASYNADIMFFSVASISEDGMLSDWSEDEAAIRVAMAKNAKRLVLMCDTTKINTVSTFTLFPLSRVDYLICDKPLPSELVKKFSMTQITSSPAYLYEIKGK